MSEAALDETEAVSAVADYKRIFKEVLDSRPSGMRIRLAHARVKLGRHVDAADALDPVFARAASAGDIGAGTRPVRRSSGWTSALS